MEMLPHANAQIKQERVLSCDSVAEKNVFLFFFFLSANLPTEVTVLLMCSIYFEGENNQSAFIELELPHLRRTNHPFQFHTL